MFHPIGSPIYGFLAVAIMQRLEATVLPKINPNLRVRYLDETFVIIKKDINESTVVNRTMFVDKLVHYGRRKGMVSWHF